MPQSRPADYYLGWFEGSVFLDFDNYKDGLICLKRISFDSFGCCNLDDKAIPMNNEDSRAFKDIVGNNISDQAMLTQIIRKTIADNKNAIWEDALNSYHLV